MNEPKDKKKCAVAICCAALLTAESVVPAFAASESGEPKKMPTLDKTGIVKAHPGPQLKFLIEDKGGETDICDLCLSITDLNFINSEKSKMYLKDKDKEIESVAIVVKRNYAEYSSNGKTIYEINDYVKRASSYRVIPLNEKAREVVERRIKNRYIFQSRNGTPLIRSSVDRTINNIKRKLTEETGYDFTFVTSHVFRHTFACDLYKKEVDLARIQKLLGHESLQITVDIYINLFSSIDPKIDEMLFNAVNSL